MSFSFDGYNVFPGITAARESFENEFMWGRFETKELMGAVIDGSARDSGNLGNTTRLRSGLLLGRITTTQKLKQWDPVATDGTQNIYGILKTSLNTQNLSADTDRLTGPIVISGAVKPNRLFVGLQSNGTAQSGTATTIVLDADDNHPDDFYNGMTLTITGGTGVGQTKVITDWVLSTVTATVSTWTTDPDSTSTYEVNSSGMGIVGHTDEFIIRSQLGKNFYVFDDVAGGLHGGVSMGGWKNIVNKIAAYTVTPADNDTLFHTRGSVVAVNFTLPTTALAVKGMRFGFYNAADPEENMVVTAGTADTMVVFNDAFADSIAYQTTAEKIGGYFEVIFDGTGWLTTLGLAADSQTVTIVTA